MKLREIFKGKRLYIVCSGLILVVCLFVVLFFLMSAKINKAKISIPAETSQITTSIPAEINQKTNSSWAKMNKFLFAICVIGGWLIITLNNIGKEATAIIIARKEWETKKGGEKPVISWTGISARSFFLLIIGVLIIYIAPEIGLKLQKLLT